MSTLGYSSFDAVAFPLKPRVPRADYTEYELSTKVNIGTDAAPVMQRRPYLLFKLNKADKEMIASLVLEFREASTATNLNFADGPTKYAKFRLLLEEPF